MLAAALAAGTASAIALVHALTTGGDPAADLPALVHLVALGALAVSTGWVATMLGVLLWEQRHGRGVASGFAWACPRACRPMLIAMCSAGATLAVAGPGTAAPTAPAPPAAALPSLDRPLGAPAQHREGGRIVVRSGDSLWSLARSRHPEDDASATASRVRALYRENSDVVGADPDLIRPGQVLRTTDGDGGAR